MCGSSPVQAVKVKNRPDVPEVIERYGAAAVPQMRHPQRDVRHLWCTLMIRDDAVSGSRGYRDTASYHYILIPVSQVFAVGPSIPQGWQRVRGKLMGEGGSRRT